MTPQFARAVDPVFLHVLQLLDRISRDERVAPEDERLRIRGALDKAEAELGTGPESQLARYALISWIDEMLGVEAPWPHREWWQSNTLEWEAFKTQDRSEQFYLKAKEAGALRQKDALEVFYVCVVLGFRGLYRYPDRTAALAGPLELAPDLETWTRQTVMSIQLGRGRPPISEGLVSIEGAPPLDGPFSLIWASLAGLALALGVAMAVVYTRF